MMTKEQFIDAYVEKSDLLSPETKRPWGVQFSDESIRIALPCACGEPQCQGWAMIQGDPEMIAYHFRYHHPKEDDGD